jgi:urease accessory protein
VTQRTQIRRGGQLVWWEQGALCGGQLDSPLTLNGHSVCATLIAVGPPLPVSLLTELRAVMAAEASFGITQTKGVLVARHLGDDSEAARRIMLTVWRGVRPHLLGREAVTPRIWQT